MGEVQRSPHIQHVEMNMSLEDIDSIVALGDALAAGIFPENEPIIGNIEGVISAMPDIFFAKLNNLDDAALNNFHINAIQVNNIDEAEVAFIGKQIRPISQEGEAKIKQAEQQAANAGKKLQIARNGNILRDVEFGPVLSKKEFRLYSSIFMLQMIIARQSADLAQKNQEKAPNLLVMTDPRQQVLLAEDPGDKALRVMRENKPSKGSEAKIERKPAHEVFEEDLTVVSSKKRKTSTDKRIEADREKVAKKNKKEELEENLQAKTRENEAMGLPPTAKSGKDRSK